MTFIMGCGQSSNSDITALSKAYKPSPDKDVTDLTEYNFSSVSGTVWKTKVEVAMAELERYTGARETKLLAPERFDPKNPAYDPPKTMRILSVLPIGTHIRIDRLLKDQGAWGGVQVTVTLQDKTNSQQIIYLDDYLLKKNRFVGGGEYSETNWGINPEMLEKSE